MKQEQIGYGGRKEKHSRRRVLGVFSALVILSLIAAGLPALANSASPGRLDPGDNTLLAEALRLKQDLGESVWLGWGRASIPMIVWNSSYAFLIGPSTPPAGWAAVDGDRLDGRPYYRQRAEGPEGAAIRLGSGWAGGLTALHQGLAFRFQEILRTLPPFLVRFLRIRTPSVPAEVEIVAALHQSFHAYQAEAAPQHYQAATQAAGDEQRYRTAAAAMQPAWEEEVSLLDRALRAGSNDEAAGLVRQFLARRQARRQQAGLDPALVEYERQTEWLDGLPKYVEVNIWRHAYIASDYQPLPAVARDPDFHAYQNFNDHWASELAELARQSTGASPAVLAYTGMAQAILLDFFDVDWKARILAGDGHVALEDLLAEAVK